MISNSRVLAAILGGFLFCAVAGAQTHSVPVVRAIAPRAPQTAARTAANGAAPSQSPAAGHPSRAVPSRRFSSGIVSTSNGFEATGGVPGLGFDFPHLAAISAAQGNNFSRRGSHRRHEGQGFYIPVLFGGVYPYYADDVEADQAQQLPDATQQAQSQVEDAQQPAGSPQNEGSSEVAASDSTAAPATPAEAPLPDNGDFILVRRDGRVLFASLFSVVGTQLQYVTPEGIRHTMAVSDIDSDATQQMNEARGSTVLIPNSLPEGNRL